MRTCWARELGGCRGGITGEHVYSESLWTSPAVGVAGSLYGEPKEIGLGSLTANILCEHHNGKQSECDTEGGRLFKDLPRINRRVRDEVMDEAARYEYDGRLIERWFLKSAINVMVAGRADAWPDGAPWDQPPLYLVRRAFGLDPMTPPVGLWDCSAERPSTAVPLLRSTPFYRDGIIYGLIYDFSLLRLGIWLHRETRPPGRPEPFFHPRAYQVVSDNAVACLWFEYGDELDPETKIPVIQFHPLPEGDGPAYLTDHRIPSDVRAFMKKKDAERKSGRGKK